jgi:hypothetical protein
MTNSASLHGTRHFNQGATRGLPKDAAGSAQAGAR